MEMILTGLKTFGAGNCIDTIFWGQVCDSCNGSAILKILSFVIELLGYGIGIVGVIAITVVGIQYLTASGLPEKVMKARMRFINMAIGLMVYVAIFGIFNFLMPMGKLGMSVLVASEEVCPEKTATQIEVNYPVNEELSARGTTPVSGGETAVAASEADLPIAPLNQDSTSVGCDPRTTFDRVYTKAHVNGKQVSINICKVTELGGSNEVNSRVSGAYAALVKAYKATGESIRASSSFRTYEKQEYFYNCYKTKKCNNGNLAAKPGTSRHEGGLAIDFSMNSTLDSWFTKNLKTFDLARTVSGEPWHVNPIAHSKYYP